jgi:Periplasmic binding protein
MRNRFLRDRTLRNSTVATLALAAALTAAVSLSGVASAKTTACSGAPVKFEAITNISNSAGAQQTPELIAGLKAAAGAITKSCELGGPVQIITCDDKFNPNDAAGCGRDVVSNKPAAVFTYSGFGDSYFPAITAAGIPILPINATSSQENTNPLSFPLGFPISSLIGQIDVAASLGKKKLVLGVLDLPSVNFFVQIAEKEAKALGITIIKEIPVPLTATDMSGFAGQTIAAGADSAIGILGPAQLIGWFKAIRQQGATAKQITFVSTTLTVTGQARGLLGADGHGMVLEGWAWNVADKTKAFVRQELAEWKAAGQSLALTDTLIGPCAWGGLHMVADALKAAHLSATSANVVKALQTKAIVQLSQKYGLNPLDYRGPAFATDPVLKTLRLFSKYQALFQINNKGKVVPVSENWLGVLHRLKLTLPVPAS